MWCVFTCRQPPSYISCIALFTSKPVHAASEVNIFVLLPLFFLACKGCAHATSTGTVCHDASSQSWAAHSSMRGPAKLLATTLVLLLAGRAAAAPGDGGGGDGCRAPTPHVLNGTVLCTGPLPLDGTHRL